MSQLAVLSMSSCLRTAGDSLRNGNMQTGTFCVGLEQQQPNQTAELLRQSSPSMLPLCMLLHFMLPLCTFLHCMSTDT